MRHHSFMIPARAEGTVPYEGEEVKVHWANRDQYYIKTSEYLRDTATQAGFHTEALDISEGMPARAAAASARPTSTSFVNGPYMSEVSSIVMP